MKIHKKLEKYQKCYRCQGTDTSDVFLAISGDDRIVGCGWCNVCRKEYSYSERIETVYDKENRI